MSDQYTHQIDGAGTVTVMNFNERTEDNRARFHWSICDEQGKPIGSGQDLNSGVSARPTARDMMPALLGFLAACGESRNYGSPDSDNWNLFYDAVAQWAAANADELAIAEYDLENPTED